MNNIELENKIKELLSIENYFDLVIASLEFDKEYKTTVFYKQTKKPLMEVLKESKMHYILQFNDITTKLQKVINSLDTTNLNDLLTKVSETFGAENSEIGEMIKTLKDLR